MMVILKEYISIHIKIVKLIVICFQEILGGSGLMCVYQKICLNIFGGVLIPKV